MLEMLPQSLQFAVSSIVLLYLGAILLSFTEHKTVIVKEHHYMYHSEEEIKSFWVLTLTPVG